MRTRRPSVAAAVKRQAMSRVRLVGDRMEVAAWSWRIVPAERRLVVRVTASTHVTAGRQTLVAGAWIRRISWLAAGWRTTARTGSKHVRLVSGSELLADSFAILQHSQSGRSRLQHNTSQAVTRPRLALSTFTIIIYVGLWPQSTHWSNLMLPDCPAHLLTSLLIHVVSFCTNKWWWR